MRTPKQEGRTIANTKSTRVSENFPSPQKLCPPLYEGQGLHFYSAQKLLLHPDIILGPK
jgi:hypothetical protein